MKTYPIIFILIIAASCVSKKRTPKEVFEGTWQYHPKLVSDTLYVSDQFGDSTENSSEYMIHSDSGWYKHLYSGNQKVIINKAPIHFCMQFNFKNDNIGQIITFRLDSLSQNPPELLAFENLTYEFHLTDSTVLLIDTVQGTEFEHQYKMLDPNRVIWDDDTLKRINMP